jgi:O-antigen/teichoic acid export membrane protein
MKRVVGVNKTGFLRNLFDKLNTKGKHFFYDQAIYSFANFATLFILARFMSSADFGIFALLNTVMLFILGFVVSLIGMPMQVFYHHFSKKEKSEYLSSMFILNVLITFLSLPFLIVFYFLFKHLDVGLDIFFIFPLTLIFYTTQEYFRRVAMLNMKTWRLMIGDFVASVLRVAIFLALGLFFNLNLFIVLVCYSGLFLIASLITFVKIKIVSFATIKKYFKKNFTFGRWSVLQHFMYSSTAPVYLFIAALYLGPELLGIYAAIEIFARFSNLVMTSSANYSLTEGSKLLKKSGPKILYSFLKRTYGRITPFLIIGSVIFIGFGKKLLGFVYPNLPISTYYLLIPLLVVRIFLEYFNQPLKVFFNLVNKPKITFFAYLISDIVSVLAAFLLVKHFGIYGIAIGSIINGIIVLLVVYYNYFKLKKNQWVIA